MVAGGYGRVIPTSAVRHGAALHQLRETGDIRETEMRPLMSSRCVIGQNTGQIDLLPHAAVEYPWSLYCPVSAFWSKGPSVWAPDSLRE